MVVVPYLFTSGYFFSQNPAPMEMRNTPTPAYMPPPPMDGMQAFPRFGP